MFRKRSLTERAWEIIPGASFWGVFLGAILLASYKPIWASVFIVVFDLYWVLKAFNVGLHLLASYMMFRVHVTLNWQDCLEEMHNNPASYIARLESLAKTDKRRMARRYFKSEAERLQKILALKGQLMPFQDLVHLVIFPFVDESVEVLSTTLDAMLAVHYDKQKLFLILASEERMGEPAAETARVIRAKYAEHFGQFFVTVHPDGLEGEIKGKSANASFAVKSVLPKLEELGVKVEQVIVSNFDSDTVVHPDYFAKVAYEFTTAEKPYQSSYQPIAVYNNNIWDSPAFIRVVSVSNSFWQFTESSRPDRLRTFSSHSMSLQALLAVGYWRKDIINEDGFIYWQCYLHFNGDYKVVPLFIPISLDTCLAETTWQTFKNQYKQKRRWAYNVEYYPHLIWPLIKSKAPWWDKGLKLFQYVEGNFNWATASILISTLGLLPLFLGGEEFLESVVAYNLPYLTQNLLRISLIFISARLY
jgi:hypothetical protein